VDEALSSLVLNLPIIFIIILSVFPIFLGIFLIASDYLRTRKVGTSLLKKRIALGTFLVLFGLYWIFAPGPQLTSEAKERHIRLVGGMIHAAELSHKENFKTYSSSLTELGFSKGLAGVTVYTKLEDIPDEDKNKIQQNHYPFFKSDTYQILLKLNYPGNGAKSFWVLDQSGFPKKIEP
jgi:hypothetical protein